MSESPQDPKDCNTQSFGQTAGTVSQPAMHRVVNLWGAILLGLGSILGTGVFVSIGIGAEVAGTGVVLAVVLAGVVATFNGLSSAQLAASHPVSGGTYEYGHRFLNPLAGFAAGWMFLCAKSASAATAALGLSGYLLTAAGGADTRWRTPVAFGFVLLWTWIVAGGIRRSNWINGCIVGFTLVGLIVFVVAGLVHMNGVEVEPFAIWSPEEWGLRNLLEATALMFVAFTGYGRIATLGEEVHEPRRTIPRAIVSTLALTILLYVAVAAVAIGLVGSRALVQATQSSAAPLEVIAQGLMLPGLGVLVGLAAVTAMAGVLLNLLLGLSRVLLAMGRRRDMPGVLEKIDGETGSPTLAVYAIGALIAGMVLIGDLRVTWSFSAFTVLVYYALTNLSALMLPPEDRLFPRVFAVFGLIACGGLAFWVAPIYWVWGVGALVVGFCLRFVVRKQLA